MPPRKKARFGSDELNKSSFQLHDIQGDWMSSYGAKVVVDVHNVWINDQLSPSKLSRSRHHIWRWMGWELVSVCPDSKVLTWRKDESTDVFWRPTDRYKADLTVDCGTFEWWNKKVSESFSEEDREKIPEDKLSKIFPPPTEAKDKDSSSHTNLCFTTGDSKTTTVSGASSSKNEKSVTAVNRNLTLRWQDYYDCKKPKSKKKNQKPEFDYLNSKKCTMLTANELKKNLCCEENCEACWV